MGTLESQLQLLGLEESKSSGTNYKVNASRSKRVRHSTIFKPDDARHTFDRFLFRVQVMEPSCVDLSIRARAPAREYLDRNTLQHLVEKHGWRENKTPTPFISTTSDLLRALNYVNTRELGGAKNIHLAIIDKWELPSGQACSCNFARESLNLEPRNLFKTEYLVWNEVPEIALLARVPVMKLRDGVFGQEFSEIFPNEVLALAQLRRNIENSARSSVINARQVAHILIDELELNPSRLDTKQLGLVLYGFSKCILPMNEVTKFKQLLEEEEGKMFMKELDDCLYFQDCRRRMKTAWHFPDRDPLDVRYPLETCQLSQKFIPKATRSDWEKERSTINLLAMRDSVLWRTKQQANTGFIDFTRSSTL